MFRNVMVTVDRSPFSESAIPYAATIARRAGGALHVVLVHAVSIPDALRGAPVALDTGLDLEIQRAEREYLDQLSERIATEHAIEPKTTLLEGSIAASIDRHARDSDIDLVVLTTHGRGGLGRAWLGSVTDRLIRRLMVPMLVIRPPEQGAAPPDPVFRHVLVALDGSELAEGALLAALSLTGGKASCTAVRVGVPTMGPGSAYIPDAARINREEIEFRNAAARSYLELLATRTRGEWDHFDIAVLTAYNAAGALIEASHEMKADLIAIATHGRGPVTRALIGSVADKVIRGAEVPVLVVPATAVDAGLAAGHEESMTHAMYR
jgi:nucleotide-binding universal stress UspA family protein